MTVEAQNLRRALERAEKEGNPPIFGQMGGGFVAAAREIQVGNLLLRKDTQTVESFG